MFGFSLGKYRVIVISITLFLVFDLGVLILNFFISSQIEQDAVSVNLAGRQRMLSQRMVKSLLEIERQLNNSASYDTEITELQNTFQLFDQTLNAFRDGGLATGGNRNAVMLDKIDKDEGIIILKDSYIIWEPYRKKLSALIEQDSITIGSLAIAAKYASANNLSLLKLMNDLTSHLETVAKDKAAFLRKIQVTGISLATINFIIILFHFIKQLRLGDLRLEEANKETNEILDTVTEGLFLLNKDYTIGTQHSKQLEGIFNRDDIEGLNFKTFLSSIVTEKTLRITVDYIDLLFGDRVSESLVASLNPLEKVEVNFSDSTGTFSTRYLAFNFNRVVKSDDQSHLLVTVADITEKVVLEKELKVSQHNAKEQFNLLIQVLPINPKLLMAFINTADKTLKSINAALEKPTKNQYDYKNKVNVIFRYVHALKGDATALGFKLMESKAHEFENKLSELQKSKELIGDDFLPLAIHLEETYKLLESVRLLFEKMADMREAIVAAEPDTASANDPETIADISTSTDWQSLTTYTEQLALKKGKKAHLDLENFTSRIPEKYQSPIRQLLIQLIRNSVSHGIESPQEREVAYKPQIAQIQAKLFIDNNGIYNLMYKDDGCGLQPEKIRQVAIDKGIYSTDQAKQLSEHELIKLLFKPGFSTSDTIDEDAGRGVGMDLVRNLINQMQGKLKISSKPGRYCQFTVAIPAWSEELEFISA